MNFVFFFFNRISFCIVCTSRDIRNHPNSTAQLRGCRIIEGFLIMTLIDHFDDINETLTYFPELVEITEYFLVYHVRGLKSLANVFPNLRVIRGNDLVKDYALAIYENANMRVSGCDLHIHIYEMYVHGRVCVQ